MIEFEGSTAETIFRGRLDEITDARLWASWNSDHLSWLRSLSGEEVGWFHSYWIEKGRRIREQFPNDSLLVEMLKLLLPPYDGPPCTLYRGENLDRYNRGVIGLCWTPFKQKAEAFGSRHNNSPLGGVLLQCEVQPDWIIAGPNEHSVWIGEHEHTVNSGALKGIVILETYPSSSEDDEPHS